MKIRGSITLSLLALAVALQCGPKPHLKKVHEYPFGNRFIAAVTDFENATGDPQYDRIAQQLGDEMVSELLSYGRLRLVERKKLAAVLNELSLEMTGLVDVKNAERVGSLLGVDALLFGSLKSVTHTTKKNSAGIAYNLVRKTGVVLAARLVTVKTGEILASAMSTSEISQGKNVALGFAKTGNMTDETTAARSALGDAVRQLANRVAAAVPEK